ncbi:hypothetical protein ABZV75_02485 [Streptomyces flaveolus]|uniref:hypothetical protein n=1 Tax=Streptomyces flaveolus TaxID=67297 RepID=UPI0033ADE86E
MPKERFNNEALHRRPHPDPPPPPAFNDDVQAERLLKRHRDLVAEFPTSDLPPIETAYWLIKPRSLVRGTWNEPKAAAEWIGRALADYAPRFLSERDRDITHLDRLVNGTAERLYSGADVSYGFYLERPSYLSLTLVTRSPNRSRPELACPMR